jgi:Tfp pilus assembly protein PilF
MILNLALTSNYKPQCSFPPWTVTLELGIIYIDLHEKQKAKVAFELVLSFDPDNAQAQNYLSFLSSS